MTAIVRQKRSLVDGQILLALKEKAKNKTTQKGIKREIPRLTIKGRKWL